MGSNMVIAPSPSPKTGGGQAHPCCSTAVGSLPPFAAQAREVGGGIEGEKLKI